MIRPPPVLRARVTRARHAHTLLELVVALALVGLIGAIVVQSPRMVERRPDGIAWQVDSVRAAAIKTGRTQRATVGDSARAGEIVAFPTGELHADSSLHLQPVSGFARQ